MIRCDFCGLEFDPACSENSCQSCPLSKACSRINCPRCGYPIMPEAGLIKLSRSVSRRLAGWLERRPPRQNGLPGPNLKESLD